MITRTPRIAPRKHNSLMRSFVMDLPASAAAELAKVNRNTADRWYRHWREVIYKAHRRAPRFFGDVEMDQKQFGGRGRKRMQAYLKRLERILPHRQYLDKARLVRAEHKVMVFGILQRQGPIYAHIIKKSDARTLLPIVRLVVEQGSTVYTDAWRGFSELGLDGYAHKSVNHSYDYSDQRGNHINGIESFWSFASRRLTKFNGIPAHTLPLHIKECEFRYNNNKADLAKALKKLLKST